MRRLEIDELPTPRFDSRTAATWRTLVDGPLTVAEITNLVTWSQETVRVALENLERCGVATRCGDGCRWRLTTYGAQVVMSRHREWVNTEDED